MADFIGCTNIYRTIYHTSTDMLFKSFYYKEL